ncbi:hypothetical protein [Archaeoglobus neptunius]|uniref:hypothetical protein n=1 Tax=Archaeoglobus neptunius TaxID=2798580 RepID=UPI00192834BE|nr:hypothetical protein [Archaeoglobus neptunius]
MLIEVVGSADEFLARINRNYGIHYELEARTGGAAGEVAFLKLTLYGLADDRIIICEIAEMARWNDKKVEGFGKTAMENLKAWIERRWKEMQVMAEELGATRGKYEWK